MRQNINLGIIQLKLDVLSSAETILKLLILYILS